MRLLVFQLSSNVKVSFPSSFLTHFYQRHQNCLFNLLVILRMQILWLLLLVLAYCSVFASIFAKCTAVLALCLDFRYSSLVPPFFYCFHTFRFSFTVLSTSLTKFLRTVDAPLVSIHISQLQLWEVHFWYIPKRSPLLQESADILLTLPIQISFA